MMRSSFAEDPIRKAINEQIRNVPSHLLNAKTSQMREHLWVTLRSQGGLALLTRPATNDGLNALANGLKTSGEVNSDINDFLEVIGDILNYMPIPVSRAYIAGDYSYQTSPGYHKDVKLIIYINEKKPFASDGAYHLLYECISEHIEMWKKVANNEKNSDLTLYAREHILSKCSISMLGSNIWLHMGDSLVLELMIGYSSEKKLNRNREIDMIDAIRVLLKDETRIFNTDIRWRATVEELRCIVMKSMPDEINGFARIIKYMGECTGLENYMSTWQMESIGIGVALEVFNRNYGDTNDISIDLRECLMNYLDMLISPARIKTLSESYTAVYCLISDEAKKLSDVMSGEYFPRNKDPIRLRDPLNFNCNVLAGIKDKQWGHIRDIALSLKTRLEYECPISLIELFKPVEMEKKTRKSIRYCKNIGIWIFYILLVLAAVMLFERLKDKQTGDWDLTSINASYDHWRRQIRQIYHIIGHRIGV